MPITFFIIILSSLLTPIAWATTPLQTDIDNAEEYVLVDQRIFSPLIPFEIPDDQVKLGQKLFSDPLLSIDQSISCEHCHLKHYGYGLNTPLTHDRFGKLSMLNSPGVAYSSLLLYQNWSGKFATLERHFDAVLTNPKVMGMNWPELIERLAKHEEYPALFHKANYTDVDKASITDAVVSYMKSLTQPSRFDAYLLGDIQRLSQQEKAGLKKFKQFGCVSCHQGVALGGNLRQKLGVIRHYIPDEERDLPRHQGFYAVTKQARDKHVFRVPGLRNVALTAPYFHDGSAESLEDAIHIMFRYQLGIEPQPQDLADIAAFLNSLTGIPYEQ